MRERSKTDARYVESTEQSRMARTIALLPLILLVAFAFLRYNALQPWVFMWSLAGSIYFGLKWLTWWNARTRAPHARWRSIAYLLTWPGMDAPAFLNDKDRVAAPLARKWLLAAAEIATGAMLFWLGARFVPEAHPMLRGWAGMLGIIFLLHFGLFQMLALFWQRVGIHADPIMSNPLRSASLSEFWGKRWNLGFRQLSYDLLFHPLHRAVGVGFTGFIVFVVSGLIHDLVISVPARGGYGLPTLYFALQGVGVATERSRLGRRAGLRGGVSGRLFMVFFTAVPVYLLFPPPFVLRVIIPFMKAAHAL